MPKEGQVAGLAIRNDEDMAAYTCKHCKSYVRGGVILICGHLFCWTCLWPFLADKPSPECPQCQTSLILHEDIMPFYGEGPNVGPEDNDFLAEPGAVPRPSGVCFTEPGADESYDEDEEDEEDENEAAELAIAEQFAEPWDMPIRRLREAQRLHWEFFPRIEYTIKCLKWIQLICAIFMLFAWCFVSIT
ncbi:hypothetical protein KR200_006781 [Drosophila serrata]|nr:hypothetical protein KR200_006781 [Drosophila serrata]